MLAYCGRRIHNDGMIKLKYGNTNTFYIPGGSGGSAENRGGLLIDTDYAGTLPMFFKAIKAAGIGTGDISHLLVTHYHPDHAGIAGELQRLGVRPVIVDVQLEHVHFSDEIFEREKRLTDRGPGYTAIDEGEAVVITCEESRSFLESIGIAGEIIHTPSHSEDSVSVVLDDGDCFVGDLEPFEYLAAYGENPALQSDWDKVMSMGPKRVFYGHANEKFFEEGLME